MMEVKIFLQCGGFLASVDICNMVSVRFFIWLNMTRFSFGLQLVGFLVGTHGVRFPPSSCQLSTNAVPKGAAVSLNPGYRSCYDLFIEADFSTVLEKNRNS